MKKEQYEDGIYSNGYNIRHTEKHPRLESTQIRYFMKQALKEE